MEFKYRLLAFLKKRLIYVIIFWLAALYAFYSYVLLGIAFFAENPYAAGLLMSLIFIISGIAYRFTVNNITKNIKDIIEDRCDPEEYLRIYRYIIHRLRRKGKPLNPSYFLDYSYGLLASGKFQDALDVLNSIKGFGRSR